MPIPFSFTAGEIARAEELNANFGYFLDIIGQLSGPGSIEGVGQFVLGPRSTALFTAKQDTGPDATAFVQYSWNTRWLQSGTTWKFERIIANNPASALRLGKQGLEFLTTSSISGNLDTQMTKIFGIKATTTADFMYIKKDVHVQQVDGPAVNIQSYRMMPVFLETPIKIYNGWVSAGTTVFNVYNAGVPREALGVIIFAHVTPSNASGAGMHFYQKRAGSITDIDRARGYVIHGYSGNSATGRVGGQGMVPISTTGDMTIERTAAFALAKVYIMGYLV